METRTVTLFVHNVPMEKSAQHLAEKVAYLLQQLYGEALEVTHLPPPERQ